MSHLPRRLTELSNWNQTLSKYVDIQRKVPLWQHGVDCGVELGTAGTCFVVSRPKPTMFLLQGISGDDELALTLHHSHCDTCKLLSGAPYTLNQIIPAGALKITKGDDLGKYTYKGDSGNGVHCVSYLCNNASACIVCRTYANNVAISITARTAPRTSTTSRTSCPRTSSCAPSS